MTVDQIKTAIASGDTALGLELGSTRIKAVLIGPDCSPLASGDHTWESRLENGVWTYSLEEVWAGIQSAYAALAADVQAQYGQPLETLGSLGVSAMMHGYLPFDADGNQLCEFRTWRNTITEEESRELTELFHFNIPQRWSIAHLWRAIRRGEPHVERLAFLTTLAGYVHWQLTGEKAVGIGEASGMFPIDTATGAFHPGMIAQFNALPQVAAQPWTLEEILPRVLPAGAPAGALTEAGARLLDPTGTLRPGVLCCPPEGDAGTGMAATNAVAPRTGNVSAGTSIFAMAVLEHDLSAVHPEIDLVTTPDGLPVAMVHCNTCTSDLNAWVDLFGQALEAAGVSLRKRELYPLLFRQALSADPDAGGLVTFNCYSGEPVIGLEDGVPLFTRRPESPLSLPNFMRAQLYGAIATLASGMEILFKDEHVTLDCLNGHGGFFKTPEVGQRLMAGALNVPVAVLSTAGEGGPWGMALLARYAKVKAPGQTLPAFLEDQVFAHASRQVLPPDPADAAGFAAWLARYKAALPAERAAAAALSD